MDFDDGALPIFTRTTPRNHDARHARYRSCAYAASMIMRRRQPRSAVFRMYGAEHARAIADGRVLVFEISADVETGWGNLVRHCAVLQRPGSDARFARASHWMQNAACNVFQAQDIVSLFLWCLLTRRAFVIDSRSYYADISEVRDCRGVLRSTAVAADG